MGYISQIFASTKAWWLELAGSFLLVFIGTSALVTLNLSSQATTPVFMLVSLVAFALPFGWLVYVLGSKTTGYFNPIISFWLWLIGHLNTGQFISVFMAQFAGAIVASIAVALLYGPTAVELGLGAVYPNSAMGAWSSAVAEALGAVVLLLSFIKVNQTETLVVKKATLLGLGMAIGMLLSMGLSGGALNPVRALAPQMAAANYTGWWVYWIGPFVAVLAVWLWQSLVVSQEYAEVKNTSTPEQTSSQIQTSESQPKKPAPLPVVKPVVPAVTSSHDQPAIEAKALKPTETPLSSGHKPEVKQGDESVNQVKAEPAKRQPLKPSFMMEDDQPVTESTASQPEIKPADKPAAAPAPTATESLEPVNEAPKPEPNQRQALPKPTSVSFVNFNRAVDIDVSDDNQ